MRGADAGETRYVTDRRGDHDDLPYDFTAFVAERWGLGIADTEAVIATWIERYQVHDRKAS